MEMLSPLATPIPCGIQQSFVCGTGRWDSDSCLLDAVLELFPIDTFVTQPVKLMQVVPGDDYVPEVVEEYKKILAKHDVGEDKIEYLERFDFYGHTDTAYCVVATGETARYANITLKKA